MNEEDRFEEQIKKLAAALRYPATPDLTGREALRTRTGARKLAWAAAVLLVIAAASFAVPPVRAALMEVLGIGAVQVRLGEPTPIAPQLEIDLPGETTLEAARASSSVYLPIPGEFGPPDRVFLLSQVGNAVVLVWEAEQVALYAIPPGPLLQKLAPENVRPATVNGNPAIWTSGDHFLELVTGDPQMRVLVTGNVLIWTEDGVTYRLETDLPVSEAISIAESLR
jgi:hypothetical protein